MPAPTSWVDGLVTGPRLVSRPPAERKIRVRWGVALAAALVLVVGVLWLTESAGSRRVPRSKVLRPTTPAVVKTQAWWVRRQIEVATILGTDGQRQGTDPWPNCADPFDSPRYTWRHTLACENRATVERLGVWDPRAWLDPPGYFRCGLQFEPRWERRYGKLCP